MTFINSELRFPIFPSTELLRGIVFFDAATAWTQNQPFGEEFVRTAIGFGVRGFIGLPLRFDVAKPLRVSQVDAAVEPKDWQTFFSIGFDY